VRVAIALAAHAGSPIDYAVEFADWPMPLQRHRLSWALASGAAAIKEARTTRVAGPRAEFQTSGARKQCCAGEICGLQGPPMELSSATMSIPLRPATVNAISWRYANGCLPYSRRAPRSVRRRTDGSSCKA
jgi:hypothetical protein